MRTVERKARCVFCKAGLRKRLPLPLLLLLTDSYLLNTLGVPARETSRDPTAGEPLALPRAEAARNEAVPGFGEASRSVLEGRAALDEARALCLVLGVEGSVGGQSSLICARAAASLRSLRWLPDVGAWLTTDAFSSRATLSIPSPAAAAASSEGAPPFGAGAAEPCGPVVVVEELAPSSSGSMAGAGGTEGPEEVGAPAPDSESGATEGAPASLPVSPPWPNRARASAAR